MIPQKGQYRPFAWPCRYLSCPCKHIFGLLRHTVEKNKFIFDDDAIKIISKELNITEDLADKYRRALSNIKIKI